MNVSEVFLQIRSTSSSIDSSPQTHLSSEAILQGGIPKILMVTSQNCELFPRCALAVWYSVFGPEVCQELSGKCLTPDYLKRSLDLV